MKTRLLALFTAFCALAILVAVALYSNLAIYISIIAIGLALALQKYVASYFGYFIIVFSNMLHEGDRIRIDRYKGDVRHIGIFYLTLDEVRGIHHGTLPAYNLADFVAARKEEGGSWEKARRAALTDVTWALLTSKEFVFNH